MEDRGDKENIYGRLASNIEPMEKYKQRNKPLVRRFKGRAMAKGAKGKEPVIVRE